MHHDDVLGVWVHAEAVPVPARDPGGAEERVELLHVHGRLAQRLHRVALRLQHLLGVDEAGDQPGGVVQVVVLAAEVLPGEGDARAGVDHDRVAVGQVGAVQPPVSELEGRWGNKS